MNVKTTRMCLELGFLVGLTPGYYIQVNILERHQECKDLIENIISILEKSSL